MTRSLNLVMRCHSVQPRHRIFVKRLWIFFARNMGKNVGKDISKNLSSKYCQKRLDHAKQYATGALKTASKREFQKRVEATGDLIVNKIADKITRVSKILLKNNSEAIEEKILRERYIYFQN